MVINVNRLTLTAAEMAEYRRLRSVCFLTDPLDDDASDQAIQALNEYVESIAQRQDRAFWEVFAQLMGWELRAWNGIDNALFDRSDGSSVTISAAVKADIERVARWESK